MGNSQRGFIRQLNRKEVTEALHTEAVRWKTPLWENGECPSVYSSEGVFGAAIAYSQEIIWKTNCKFLLTRW